MNMAELLTVAITGGIFGAWLIALTAGIVRLTGKRRERVNLNRFHARYFAQKQFFGKLK